MPSKAFSQANLLGTDNTLQATSLSADIPITELYANIDELPASGTLGEQAFVQSTNRLYIWNGSGWYSIALINTTPTWDSGGQPAASYELDADSPQGSVIVTLAASDPEGIPITYSYIQSGQMDSIATISQDSSIFTITPKTEAQVPDGGTGSITFRASDGINILPSVSSFTLNFITGIENSKYTTLLATVDGTSDNNNITDASTNNHTITVNGDVHAGTFSPYRSGDYSVYLPAINGGSEHNISFDHDAGFNFGSGDFTIEFSVYFPSNSTSTDYLFQHGESTGSWNVNTYNGVVTVFLNGISIGNDVLADSSNTISNNLNKWIYYAIVRSGTTVTMYRNGTSIATKTSAQNANVGATLDTTNTEYLHINRRRAGTGDGTEFYFKDFRVTKGLARTINNINRALTSDANTSILVGNLPYIGDASSNSHTATYIGSPSIKPISPYDYDEYDAAVHGGSVYFDGTTDYLLINSPPTLGANDWTFETWYYASNSLTYNNLLSQGPGNNTVVSNFSISGTGEIWIQTYTTTNVVLYNTAAGIIKADTWNHIVLTHDYDGSNGGTYKIYVNGNQVGSVSYTSGYYWNSGGIAGTALGIGQYRYNTQANGECYFSDWKISSGITYSSNFTPPTTPLSSSGAELLIKGTDASIIDKSQVSNLKLVGNTTGSTTQVKFANTKSMYFDGTGDYIDTNKNLQGDFGTGDFTVEGWFYLNEAIGANRVLLGSGTGDGNDEFMLILLSNGLLYYDWFSVSDYIQSTSTITAYTWHHIAVTRSGTQLDLWLDGTSVASNSSHSYNYNGTSTFKIGMSRVGAFFWNGYIQDVRISNGLARYTANFTPPTASLEG